MSVKNYTVSLCNRNEIKEFIENIPKLQHMIEFNCSGCGEHNNQMLEGVSNFLG